ncbi:MAG: aryl-sulfate sulfotransferase [Planctomycetes bacterium]|nr:aryl-sulfate sulfotransferase [Planctomycetota bacterium]
MLFALSLLLLQDPHTQGTTEGFTLYAPLRSSLTYLVDEQGEVVHQWKGDAQPGNEARILADGRLLRCAREQHEKFRGGGQGGRVEILNPDSSISWSWKLPEGSFPHHDVEVMPNGNLLILAWEARSLEEAEALGREPGSVSRDGIWPDCLFEVQPVGKDEAKIVWKWTSWDHLVQDRDEDKPGFGVVSEHPEKIDINLGGIDRRSDQEIDAEQAALEALGYTGEDEAPSPPKPRNRPPGLPEGFGKNSPKDTPKGGGRFQADWMHSNAVAYDPERDLIAISVRHFSEIWVIDHSTSTEEAKSSKGGAYGRGGDLLWRWGNPQNYHRGDQSDQVFFGQHDVRWIPSGFPGEGNLTVFNNGDERKFSSVEEIAFPLVNKATPVLDGFDPWGPSTPAWEYVAEEKKSFFSGHISGAIRLQNGNTLVTSGEQQWIFEVNPAGEITWEHKVPEERMAAGAIQRPGGFQGPPGPQGQGNRDRPRGRPNRKGDGGGGGPGIGGGLFRAYRYAADDPGIRALFEALNLQD